MLPPVTFESDRYLTPDEFHAFVQEREAQGDINHYELLNRRIVMNPPAGWPHGSVEGRLIGLLYPVASERGEIFGSSQGFVMPDGDVVEPDVSFVSTARLSAATKERGKFLEIVPDLVVEILSGTTASRDRGEKRGIYEKNGVREYWLVDSRALRVTVLALTSNAYRDPSVFERDDTLRSTVLPDLAIPVVTLFPR